MPDWNNPTPISSGYVATEKCWLFTHNMAQGGGGAIGYAYTYVNGFKISDTYVTSWNYNVYNDNLVPLDIGDTVTTEILRGVIDLTVFPMKDNNVSNYYIKY